MASLDMIFFRLDLEIIPPIKYYSKKFFESVDTLTKASEIIKIFAKQRLCEILVA